MERLIFSGKIRDKMYEYFENIQDIKGDFVEFGVFEGSSFILLAGIAISQGKRIHGFDSFKGLAKPTKKDYLDGKIGKYPKGRFNTNGCRQLRDKLEKIGHEPDKDYCLWEGFIPDVFKKAPESISFSFAFVDLDHYMPTVSSLGWLFERLEVGGLVLCDDYFPEKKHLASPAIREFMEKNKEIEILENGNNQVLFKKIK